MYLCKRYGSDKETQVTEKTVRQALQEVYKKQVISSMIYGMKENEDRIAAGDYIFRWEQS